MLLVVLNFVCLRGNWLVGVSVFRRGLVLWLCFCGILIVCWKEKEIKGLEVSCLIKFGSSISIEYLICRNRVKNKLFLS